MFFCLFPNIYSNSDTHLKQVTIHLKHELVEKENKVLDDSIFTRKLVVIRVSSRHAPMRISFTITYLSLSKKITMSRYSQIFDEQQHRSPHPHPPPTWPSYFMTKRTTARSKRTRACVWVYDIDVCLSFTYLMSAKQEKDASN